MDSRIRILSLLPAATEIVYLLGLGKYLVGVSHECDYPPEVKKIPRVTFSEISNSMTSREINEKVKKSGHSGVGINHIKGGILEKLKPNLILTQELCEVCATTPSVILSDSEGSKLYSSAAPQNDNLKIISLEPESVEDILKNILLIGESSDKGQESRKNVNNLRTRLKILNSKFIIHNSPKPKVLVIEWLDPIMVAGHWVPEMVQLAGGSNLGTKPGDRSKKITTKQLKQFNPDILIISPCGFDIGRVLRERFMINDLRFMINRKDLKIYVVDGNAYMTRPGPRIIDGIEILSEIIHPDVFKRKHDKLDWQSLSF